MQKYLALRAKKLNFAKKALSAVGCDVLNSNVERIEPALRNLAEGLHKKGMVYDIDGCGVFWVLVDDERSVESYQDFSAVECVFSEGWYREQAQKVRYLKGMAYCDATEAWAEGFELPSQQRVIDLQFKKPDAVRKRPTVIEARPDSGAELESMPRRGSDSKPRLESVPTVEAGSESRFKPELRPARSNVVSRAKTYEMKESMSLDLEPLGGSCAGELKAVPKRRPAFKKRAKIEEVQLDFFGAAL